MDGWLIWLIVAAALAIAETATLSFVLVMFATGAVAASITDAAGGPLFLQVVLFAVVAVILIVVARPFLRRHFDRPGQRTNADALVGQEAVVLDDVTAEAGLVRLNGGAWTARTLDRSFVLPAGTYVRVARIDGATAFVVPDGAGVNRGPIL